MRYSMVYQDGGGATLVGATNGKIAYGNIIRAIDKEPPVPTALFLDFRDAQVATGSFLRESVFALKVYLRAARSNFYPVIANANDVVVDELSMVATLRSDAIICCDLDHEERPSSVGLIGQLDPKQQETFELVNQLKEADAITLMEDHDESDDKKATKWNNRLAGLAARGLILEFSKGRAKYYRPVLEAGK